MICSGLILPPNLVVTLLVSETGNTQEIDDCLARLKKGDMTAREQLLATARGRLLKMARRMLKDYSSVRPWEETDDVLQNAMLRICRTLDHVIPESTAALMRLAARDIRCSLIDLARHYAGPLGPEANREQRGGRSSVFGKVPAEDTSDPAGLSYWTEFHEAVESLPDELQAVADLIWYQGLTQEEAGTVLRLSERTVQRYWREVCFQLHYRLGGIPPGLME